MDNTKATSILDDNKIDKSSDKLDFSRFFDEKLRALNERTGDKMTKKDVAIRLGLSYEMLRKIVNKEKPTRNRDCIIAISLVLRLNTDEADEALNLYGMSELQNVSDTRDDLIITLLEQNIDEAYSINHVNISLSNDGFDLLKIIDHRKKEHPEEIDSQYSRSKILVSYNIEDFQNRNPYDSLESEYFDTTKYIQTKMKLISKHDNSKFILSCLFSIRFDTSKGYGYRIKTSYNNSVSDETGTQYPPGMDDFKPYFFILKNTIKHKRKNILNNILDTRSYKERISARVIDYELHVFYETYNYTVPELGEYYFMDYVNGKYTLYVCKTSRFMKLYLSDQEYTDVFGKDPEDTDNSTEIYNSIEDVENAVEESRPYLKEQVKDRKKAFIKAKEKIDALIQQLHDNKAFIRNLDNIFDNPAEVLIYYNVTDQYEVIYDEDGCEIIGCNIQKPVSFSLSDNRNIELTFEDLCNGFKLGLSSIEEVGEFLYRHKTLRIEMIL